MFNLLMNKVSICSITFNCFMALGQGEIDTIKKKDNYVLSSISLNNHVNGGGYFNRKNVEDYSLINSVFEDHLAEGMLTFSLGIRCNELTQGIDFGHKISEGYYTVGFGHDKLKTTYFGYYISYNFLKRVKFPLKPKITINLAYIDKNYNFFQSTEWGGGNTASRDFYDDSKTYILQIPMGITFKYRRVFLDLSYYFNVMSWVLGSVVDNQKSYSASGSSYEKAFSEKYSVNSTQNEFEKQKAIFSLRLGYEF